MKPQLNPLLRLAMTLALVMVMILSTGCFVKPPKTQGVRTAEEFQEILSEVVPPGTSKEDAQHKLKYGEGIDTKEIASGDFIQNQGQPNERTFEDIHYLYGEQIVYHVDGTQKQINIAVVIEDDRVTKVLATEEPPSE